MIWLSVRYSLCFSKFVEFFISFLFFLLCAERKLKCAMLFKIFQVFIAWRLCHARLLSHSVELYNEMLDYPIARQYAWDTTTINQLGEVFLEHKVNDTFGLTLLHNHFHLQPGEQMIEVVYNGSSRTEPHLIEDQPVCELCQRCFVLSVCRVVKYRPSYIQAHRRRSSHSNRIH